MCADGVHVLGIVFGHALLWLEKLASDPLKVLTVNPGCTWESTLGQGADCNQTAHNSQWVLLALLDGVSQCLVAELGSLHWVVVVLGEHTTLEWSNQLGTLSCCTNILDTGWAHMGLSSWTHIPKRLAVAVHSDHLTSSALSVSGTKDGTHFVFTREIFETDPK